MPMVYDNWERLVVATLDREKLRQLALAPSRETSFNSSISSSTFNSAFDFLSDFSSASFNSAYDFQSDFSSASFNSAYDFQSDPFTDDYVSGSVTDRVVEAAENARRFKVECAIIKSTAEKLAGLLRQVKRTTATSNDFYERPGRRIIPVVEIALERALKLLLKCRRQGVRRVFNIIPAGAFQKILSQLDRSIGDVSWLLQTYDLAHEYLGVPPICYLEPALFLVWEQIAILYRDSPEDRADAAASLGSLARDNYRYTKLIIEEEGVKPLLKLVEDGRPEGQENAAKAIAFLGTYPENVEHILDAGSCHVFVEMLKRSPMKVQAVVAWAVSELATHYPKCQDIFAAHDIIPLLLSHLDSETTNLSLFGEMEDPATKDNIKIMAAKALWQLAKGNPPICRNITADTRPFLSFAAVLEKGPEEAQYNSAMALMEITALAEMSVLDLNLPGRKAVVDQLLRIVDKAKSEALLIPCIKIIGNLCRIFGANETRTIIPLVKLLDGREDEVSREICITLTKFTCSENTSCLRHSRMIVDAGGAKYLVDLLYFGDENLQICALILLCHIIKHVPENEQLAKVELLIVLEWAWNQSFVRLDKDVEKLLPEAKQRLEFRIPRIKRIALN